VGKSGKIYRQGDGIALEPQHFPDAPNKPAFASVRLNPGETYSNRMVFKLSIAK
jgi:aldose 1-epimerase